MLIEYEILPVRSRTGCPRTDNYVMLELGES